METPLDLMNQLAAGEIGFLATEGYFLHRKLQLLPVRGSKFLIAVSVLVLAGLLHTVLLQLLPLVVLFACLVLTAADFLVPATCTLKVGLKGTVLAAQAGTVLAVYLTQHL